MVWNRYEIWFKENDFNTCEYCFAYDLTHAEVQGRERETENKQFSFAKVNYERIYFTQAMKIGGIKDTGKRLTVYMNWSEDWNLAKVQALVLTYESGEQWIKELKQYRNENKVREFFINVSAKKVHLSNRVTSVNIIEPWHDNEKAIRYCNSELEKPKVSWNKYVYSPVRSKGEWL